MKKNLKLIAALFLAALLALLLTVPAQAGGTGAASFGITNASFAAASTNSALGQSAVSVDQNDTVGISAEWGSTTTNAANAVWTLYRVNVAGNVETANPIVLTYPQLTSTPGTTVTNQNYVFTNLSSTLIGPATTSLVLSNVANTSALGVMVSPNLTVQKKRLQAPN